MTRDTWAALHCSPSSPSCPVTTSTSSWVPRRLSPPPPPRPSPDTSSTNLQRTVRSYRPLEGGGNSSNKGTVGVPQQGCSPVGVKWGYRLLWSQVSEAVVLNLKLAVLSLGAEHRQDRPWGKEKPEPQSSL